MPVTVARTTSKSTSSTKSTKSKPKSTPAQVKASVGAGKKRRGNVKSAAVKRQRVLDKSLPKDLRCVPAREGDHYAIHDFLQQAVQYPNDEQFTAQTERPDYAPNHRLLLVQDDQIVGHVLSSQRSLALGEGVELPTVELSDLVTAAEYRGRGYGTLLLQWAMSHWAGQGVVMGTLRTTTPGFYQTRGWCIGPRHSWSAACPRDILSLLSPITCPASLQVRVWRQVEQAAIQRLHGEACRRQPGQVHRSQEEWRWLVSRGVCDRVYVAVEGTCLDDTADDAIIAFAFVQRGRIVELCAEPGREDASRELLRRVCYDAIESSELEVRYDGPAESGLHSFLTRAGGQHFHVDAECNMVNMMRLESIEGYLTHMAAAFERRAERTKIARPSELGLAIVTPRGVEKYRIVLAKKSVQIAAGKVGRSYLTGQESDMQQLLLGRLSLTEAISSGRIESSTQTAFELADSLLPELPLHRSSLDDLRPVRSLNC